jgi:hypothetical protein
MDAVPIFDRCALNEISRPNYGVIDIDLDRADAEVRLSLEQHEKSSGLVKTAFTESVPLSTLRKRDHRPRLSAVAWPNGKAYFFRGNCYTRYSISSVGSVQHADAGYPIVIADRWPGLPDDFNRGIDAGYVQPGSKTSYAYLFKGNGYIRSSADADHSTLSPPKWTPSANYPMYIKLHWPELWDWDFDAVVPWPDGYVYFFRGTKYQRCQLGTHKADGAPKDIKGDWPGLAEAFPDGIDAGVVWTSGKAYFFKGEAFVRYNIGPANKGVEGGVQPIALYWPDLASF